MPDGPGCVYLGRLRVQRGKHNVRVVPHRFILALEQIPTATQIKARAVLVPEIRVRYRGPHGRRALLSGTPWYDYVDQDFYPGIGSLS